MAAAAAEAARVVAGVPGHPMDTPTPCDDWDLRTLVNHVIVWTAYSAERRAYGALSLSGRDPQWQAP